MENVCEQSLVLDKSRHKTPLFVYLVSILSAVGGFLFGYDTGVVSGAVILLRDYFSLNYLWQEIVVSVAILSAWIFSLAGGICADRWGRKPVIIFASFLFTVGALIMALALEKLQLVCGRFVVGAGIGLASMAVPMYIAEVSPAEIRGRLVTINNCSITLGQLISSIVDGIFSTDHVNGWRYMLGIAAVPSAVQFFSFLFMPESPRWLVSRGKYEEALRTLFSIRAGTADVESEFNSIKMVYIEGENERQQKGGSSVMLQVLKTPTLRRALIVGCSLQIIQQLAGINTVMYYSATIIQMSGIKDNTKVIWLSCATAAMNSVCSFAAFFFIERLGRRILTLASLAGVIFSLCFLAVSFQLADMHSPKTVAENITVSQACTNYRDCASCINSGKCGFCFLDMPDGAANGSCLLASTDNPPLSIGGACNATLLPSNELTWTYQWCPSSFSWMILLGLLLYLMSFAPGLGSTPWTINSEIYPLWARSTCYATATSFNWMFNFIVSLSFLSLTQVLTKSGTFWLYAIISALGLIFLFLMLPETRGKSLEEVESLFVHPWWKQMLCKDQQEIIQYVHIRGFNRADTADDSGDD